MTAKSDGIRILCSNLLAHYQGNGPFHINACDLYAEHGERDAQRQRFYKAVKAGCFEIESMPDGMHKNALYRPGPNIAKALRGEPLDGKAHHIPPMPDLCRFFGINMPDNISEPYPDARIVLKTWE